MTPSRLATWAFVALLLLGLAELMAAARAYRPRIADTDWAELERAIDTSIPLFVDPPWLGPAARQHLAHATTEVSVGAPDHVGIDRWSVVSLAGEHTRSVSYLRDQAGLPTPELVEQESFGGLSLSTYVQPAALVEHDSLLRARDRLQLSAQFRGLELDCRTRNDGWQCGPSRAPMARATYRMVEVDYRPRYCLALDVRDGVELTLRVPMMPLAGQLRGHVGLGDFNARLRNDAPIAVRLAVGEQTVMQRVFADDEGWAAFVIDTPPGPADVEMIIGSPITGTWSRDADYEAARRRLTCIELRNLGEPS